MFSTLLSEHDSDESKPAPWIAGPAQSRVHRPSVRSHTVSVASTVDASRFMKVDVVLSRKHDVVMAACAAVRSRPKAKNLRVARIWGCWCVPGRKVGVGFENEELSVVHCSNT